MTYYYSDPDREHEAHALPDVEVFYAKPGKTGLRYRKEPGWYYWFCFPGCLPDGDPIGPFETEAEALNDARGARTGPSDPRCDVCGEWLDDYDQCPNGCPVLKPGEALCQECAGSGRQSVGEDEYTCRGCNGHGKTRES